MKKFLKNLLPYLIIIIVVILVRSFIITPVRVNGESMYPTLKGNEIMLLNRLGTIDRFDIVVLQIAEEDDYLIKRVIGLPGDTIEIRKDKIYINGKKLDENYGYLDPLMVEKGSSITMHALTLKDDEYFVLGDNRLKSLDSHIFGTVTKKEIQGTTNFVIYPFKTFGKVK